MFPLVNVLFQVTSDDYKEDFTSTSRRNQSFRKHSPPNEIVFITLFRNITPLLSFKSRMGSASQMEPRAVHVPVADKNDSSGEGGSITHLEGANVRALDKPRNGYGLHEFVNLRQKILFKKRLVWKIDLLIVPTLSLIYFVSFLVCYWYYKAFPICHPLNPFTSN